MACLWNLDLYRGGIPETSGVGSIGLMVATEKGESSGCAPSFAPIRLIKHRSRDNGQAIPVFKTPPVIPAPELDPVSSTGAGMTGIITKPWDNGAVVVSAHQP